jgi:hypothetical protein
MVIRRIAYLGELDRTPDAPDHLGIRQGLMDFDGFVVDPVLNNPEEVVRQVNAKKPDLIIHGNTDSLGQGLGKMLKQYKQVFWMLDYQPQLDGYCWDSWDTDGYDMVFISNRDQMKYWGERFGVPCHYLPHGCVVKDPVKDEKHHHKAVFIGGRMEGGWYDDRAHLLDDIESLISFDTINAEGVEGRNQVWKDMPAIYHTSDCVIDISHSWTADGYASGRFFYSAGLGGCSITKRFPGCEELYPTGTKAYFDTPLEAYKLIKFYQDNPRERERMKNRAWEHNKKFHNYTLRFNRMIECLKKYS